MQTPRTVNFPDVFCIFNEVKRCIFSFCEFLEDVKFLENRNKIFEESSLKAFLRQSFRVFDFSNLSSDSRYFESVSLKFEKCVKYANEMTDDVLLSTQYYIRSINRAILANLQTDH